MLTVRRLLELLAVGRNNDVLYLFDRAPPHRLRSVKSLDSMPVSPMFIGQPIADILAAIEPEQPELVPQFLAGFASLAPGRPRSIAYHAGRFGGNLRVATFLDPDPTDPVIYLFCYSPR